MVLSIIYTRKYVISTIWAANSVHNLIAWTGETGNEKGNTETKASQASVKLTPQQLKQEELFDDSHRKRRRFNDNSNENGNYSDNSNGDSNENPGLNDNI